MTVEFLALLEVKKWLMRVGRGCNQHRSPSWHQLPLTTNCDPVRTTLDLSES